MNDEFIKRPMYENQNDLDNENNAKEFIENKFSIKLEKLPISYSVDFALIQNGQITGFVEYKKHNASFNQYPTKLISYRKIVNLINLADCHYGTKSFLIIGFTDGIYRCEITNNIKGSYIEWGGRTKNTRDRDDIEPVLRIPNEAFMKL